MISHSKKKSQNIGWFRNNGYWNERLGIVRGDEQRFKWASFYEEFADKLLLYKDRRHEILDEMRRLSSENILMPRLKDKFADGNEGPLEDICPFTVMGAFNRDMSDENRIATAEKLADFLGVTEHRPKSFEGIPKIDNRNSWYFRFAKNRKKDDIELFWEVFEQAIIHSNTSSESNDQSFIEAFDAAMRTSGAGWRLTSGLYRARPWHFPTLDSHSTKYLENILRIQIGKGGYKNRCSGKEYLDLKKRLEDRFRDEKFPSHSFPELSLNSFEFKEPPVTPSDEPTGGDEVVPVPAEHETYTLDNIVSDGCFMDRDRLEAILDRLRKKKNLVLQGPPGTGKTWLAKRLAFALMGERNSERFIAFQFHPNLSYEDFVRGWRPGEDARLNLVDGAFLQIAETARNDSDNDYVIVIEEINRGNPAQIFGEMLTLLEADKRSPDEALELSYSHGEGDERFYIPENLYVIGTMNVADRSLALVDLALRRRFAFADLEPMLGERWRNWMRENFSLNTDVLSEIESRIAKLNNSIADDQSLGPQFRVGHSYVTPPPGSTIDDAKEWFRHIVEFEIGPLLDEIWFDDSKQSRTAKEQLLSGF